MKKTIAPPPHVPLELDGTTYVVLRRAVFDDLCRLAGVGAGARAPGVVPAWELAAWAGEPASLGRRLADRRGRAGLTQAQLAERAGVRTETLNRIERGHTNPDFGTIRKLVTALVVAEHAQGQTAVPRGRKDR